MTMMVRPGQHTACPWLVSARGRKTIAGRLFGKTAGPGHPCHHDDQCDDHDDSDDDDDNGNYDGDDNDEYDDNKTSLPS